MTQIEIYKRLCVEAASVITALHRRILDRIPDERSQHVADRAVLLDADRWLSEAYRMQMRDLEAPGRDEGAGMADKSTGFSDIN